MISQELIKKLAVQYQTTDFPNIVREYFQHLFLSELYKLPASENLLFKGGTALRVIYGSSRFSEDLDFSLFQIGHYQKKEYAEILFITVLKEIEKTGITVEIDRKSDVTAEGYFGDANFQIYNYPAAGVAINISSRNGRNVKGEIDTVVNDFVPSYNILHLPKEEIVEEKVFNALIKRKKVRDFYDLYFLLRKGMFTPDQKKRLADLKNDILREAEGRNFHSELNALLPFNQHGIINDFYRALSDELKRQVADVS
ncbi:nucleotidyl transferase AbiEii/AbiGii toxin family protein [Candidatus Peregrinibacteria bacterium]|nr:nucleotidyl transferase AbiEii/AbiGii toxin family protein [Candidatus Peregrinibacteria bacterium]